MDSATVVEEFLRLLAKGEAQRALALVSDDVVCSEPDGLRYGGEYRGKKAFVGVLKAIAENYQVDLTDVRVVDGGDVFVAIADVRWTSVATSRALDTRFCELYTVADGLITGIEVFPKDTRSLHRAHGLTMTSQTSDTDAARVDAAVDGLLAACDPETAGPGEFFGAQFDAGLAWVHHPAGLGGLGLRAGLQRRIDDRLATAGARRPILRNPIGVGMGAPTVVEHGTPEQCERFLRPLFTCEELWCQLFSEPGAGSDLAGLATRAVRDGAGWVVTGQKVWTSLAHLSRRGLLLARTDPEQPKHRGLSYFVVDMQAPGVTVRPLRQMTGSAEFNEVFLDGVRIADADRLGAVGEGWRVAATTLSNERVALSGAGSGASNIGGSSIDALLRLAGERGAWTDPGTRDRVVRLYLESRVIRLTNQRARAARRRSAVGPEGSVTKLFQGLHNRRLQECLLDLAGDGAAAWEPCDDAARRRATGFLRAQANTIEGGTSNISRNIIGERVLGLPREPGPPRDLPWKDIPRSATVV